MPPDPPIIHVEQNPDGTATATAIFYAVSLMAFREAPHQVQQVQHQPSWVSAHSDAEAEAGGRRQCEAIWPSGEGWKHSVVVKLITMRLDLYGGGSAK